MSENRETRWPKADGGSVEPIARGGYMKTPPPADLEVVDQLPDPVTGELHPATPDRAAFVRLQAADMIRSLRDLQALCDAILADEARRQGTKTLHLDGVTAVLSGGPTTVYDPVELRENLATVGCPENRIDALVTPVVTFKVNHSVRRQLAGANEAYASAIELASHEEVKPWRAAIK